MQIESYQRVSDFSKTDQSGLVRYGDLNSRTVTHGDSSSTNNSLDPKTREKIAEYVYYDNIAQKHVAKTNIKSLSGTYHKDFHHPTELETCVDSVGREAILQWGVHIENLRVKAPDGNTAPVLAIIDLKKNEKILSNAKGILYGDIQKYRISLFEKNQNGEITRVFYPVSAIEKNLPLGAIGEIEFPAIAEKPIVEHSHFSNFDIYVTDAKISYIPNEEYYGLRREILKDFGITLPTTTPSVSQKAKKDSVGCSACSLF